METMSQYLKLRDLVNALEPEAVKVKEKGNKAAGTRLRKGLQEVKKQAQILRGQISEDLRKG